ncbi:DUF6105 family protein [Rhizobium sp. L1K21]|uniref:DUF6105 family protein n=1 Tax=Rhizobium sp. L1K21 TaxID=2954933 RepID=UPI0020933DC7|nr:DUF6105 family protein [Rhizobium sp. L1K21]MCO6186452.1 DUF6105 family protein [Rhizobium sp. L1K21]
MKWAFIFWIAPLAFLGGWYGLSYYDMSFGYFMLSRQAHDLVFQIYGNILGLPPEDIPPLVLRALVIDTAVLFAILVFRRRKKIIAAYKARFGRVEDEPQFASDKSLSSAP